MNVFIVLVIAGTVQWAAPRPEWEACVFEAGEMQNVYDQVMAQAPSDANRNWQFVCLRREKAPEEGDILQ